MSKRSTTATTNGGGSVAEMEVPGGVPVVTPPGMSKADTAAAAAVAAEQAAGQAETQFTRLENRLAEVNAELEDVGDAAAESKALSDEVEKLEKGLDEYVLKQQKALGEAMDRRNKFHYAQGTQERIVRRRQLLKEKGELERTIGDLRNRA